MSWTMAEMLSYANMCVVSDECFDIASELGSTVAAKLGPNCQQEKEKVREYVIRCIEALSKIPLWQHVEIYL